MVNFMWHLTGPWYSDIGQTLFWMCSVKVFCQMFRGGVNDIILDSFSSWADSFAEKLSRPRLLACKVDNISQEENCERM